MLPFPGSLSMEIVPLCSSTIFDTIASPSPTPSDFVVKNGLNMSSKCSFLMPEHRSTTEISTWFSISRVYTVTVPPVLGACAGLGGGL